VPYTNGKIAELLAKVDLGNSVAEQDNLLEVARVENSAFTDLLNDRVDLIPGTKGSGKSALFRIFVDFLPGFLIQDRKVVIAHGVQAPGDPVFHAFADQFGTLSEDDFVSFWCIYLISLAHEQFLKGERYQELLGGATAEIDTFRTVCSEARIPEIKAKKSLRDIIAWTLQVLKAWRPKLTFDAAKENPAWEFDLFGMKDVSATKAASGEEILPVYLNRIKDALEAILRRTKLSLWLMVDRLDEIFPRRSRMERLALRGLLRATRHLSSDSIRIKVFLRDDMLDEVVRAEGGFTALTHVTARSADTLRWTQEQILTMLVKRFFANAALANYLGVNNDKISASASYRVDCFDKIFTPSIYRGSNQSKTMRWIWNRCADGRGVVTPRDVLDLLIRAKERQQDLCTADPDGSSEWIIGSPAIQYGFAELSKRKRQTYLEAEFKHLWDQNIAKFVGGNTEYDEAALRNLLGKDWQTASDNLVAIGVLSKGLKAGSTVYTVPRLYRHSLNLTQGKA